jgi:mannose/cellobiose epimerase-like protein (N-acyl-D-glucosamine 2-epimerase family)
VLNAICEQYRRELFETVLPFWDRHGIDHEHGGFLCRLNHDGALLDDTKFHWFQGRGLWIYSFLYNQFGKDPSHLEIARRTRDFLLRFGPQPDGWWAESWTRDGQVLRPYRGDYYGMYFAAEGLFEYAHAAQDQEAFDTALDLFLRLRTVSPEARPQGYWMMNILIATQFLRRWSDGRVLAIAGEAIDAILNRHYNRETGLNMEVLAEPDYCVFGHSVECLWMVMEEAVRRNDDVLWQTCAGRIRHHLEAGWDHVFGGLAAAIRVDQPCFEWPAERPVGTGIELRVRGEINYNKFFWAVNEVLIATVNIYLRTRAEWSERYLHLARAAADKFSLRARGFPLYLLFTDRRFSFQPDQQRQDNYHLPRQLMLNVLALERASR